MGIFDRIFGGREAPTEGQPAQAGLSEDEQAIARYRYMLKTAPPETIEQAHAEAFAKLTPEQRRKLLEQLRVELPDAELASAARMGDNPAELARVATRAEVRQPGTMERVFGRLGGGPGIPFRSHRTTWAEDSTPAVAGTSEDKARAEARARSRPARSPAALPCRPARTPARAGSRSSSVRRDAP